MCPVSVGPKGTACGGLELPHSSGEMPSTVFDLCLEAYLSRKIPVTHMSTIIVTFSSPFFKFILYYKEKKKKLEIL